MAMAAAASPLLVLASTRAVLTQMNEQLVESAATISISLATGLIVAVEPTLLPASAFASSVQYKDVSPHLLLPGLVDAHVHLNQPGRTDWEGFATGTRAAAAGGVTTVVDMPLNSIPPTTSVAALQAKVDACRGQCWVDVAFYGGVVPGNASDLLPLVRAGVRGFKAFLIDSGVEEFPAVSIDEVAMAMHTLKDTPTTLMFHAEMLPPDSDSDSDGSGQPDGLPANCTARGSPDDGQSYSAFLQSRPPDLETRAVTQVIARSAEAPQLHLHIVHLSAAECIPQLRAARARGVRITAETCFHYLALVAESVPAGDTRHKCCPPIRDAANQRALWAELEAVDSCIVSVVSDHSPCPPQLKLLPPDGSGDFQTAWGGISSLGMGLPILHTAARRSSASRPLQATDLVRLCCQAPARQVGLGHRKGGLAVGLDGDVCVFDDAAAWQLATADMQWRHHCSPWLGSRFCGRVVQTWLRGRCVFRLGSHDSGLVGEPRGEPILEQRTTATF